MKACVGAKGSGLGDLYAKGIAARDALSLASTSRPIRAAARSLSASAKRSRSQRRSRGPRPLPSRQLILFLAANPSGTPRLALDKECAAIERELRMAPDRDHFDFRSKWAVSVDEMMIHLNELQPTIIHFSGHGSSGAGAHGGGHRDVEPLAAGSGICLERELERRLQHVNGPALAKMIAAGAPSARVVVLNACFSDAVAESLCQVVDCVVSMTGAVDDDAARSFAEGFYRALGHGRSVGNAVAQAVALLSAKQLPSEHRPVCRTRDGLSPDLIFLP
jgi:hypothetical protein